jgi:hypothetical protein
MTGRPELLEVVAYSMSISLHCVGNDHDPGTPRQAVKEAVGAGKQLDMPSRWQTHGLDHRLGCHQTVEATPMDGIDDQLAGLLASRGGVLDRGEPVGQLRGLQLG